MSEFKEKMAYLSLVTGTVFYRMLQHAQCSHSIDVSVLFAYFPSRSNPIHAVFNQIINDRRICESGSIAKRAVVIFGNFAKDAAHNFARSGFW